LRIFSSTTFPVSTPFFHGMMERFLEVEGGIFKGPYISVKLPYRTSSIGPAFFVGDVQVAPACILWPDKDRQWDAVVPRSQGEMEELLISSDNPDNLPNGSQACLHTGEGIWIFRPLREASVFVKLRNGRASLCTHRS